MKKSLFVGIFLMFGLLACIGPAYGGQYIWVHGVGSMYLGGNLHPLFHDFTGAVKTTQTPNETDTIYFAIPSLSGGAWAGDKVVIKFNTMNYTGQDGIPRVPCYITRVDVYNGPILVKSVGGNWGGTGYQQLDIDLDAPSQFDTGMAVIIHTLSSSSASSSPQVFAELHIHAVGAHFIQTAGAPAATGLLLLD